MANQVSKGGQYGERLRTRAGGLTRCTPIVRDGMLHIRDAQGGPVRVVPSGGVRSDKDRAPE